MKRMICVALMLVVLIGCSGDDPWQAQYDLGIRYLSEGNYREAILSFEAGIEIDAMRIDAYGGLIAANIAADDWQAAERALEAMEALELDRAGAMECKARRYWYDQILAFQNSDGYGVKILNVFFDKERFKAGEETAFDVMVLYRLPEGELLNVDVATLASRDSNGTMRWDAPKGGMQKLQGSGVALMNFTAAPARIAGKYAGLRAGAWSQMGEGLGWDEWYISDEGALTYSYGPTGDRGQILFENRWDYLPFETMTAQDQEFVQTAVKATVANDTDTLYALAKEWDTVAEYNNINFYTGWDQYKIEITKHPYEVDEESDEGYSLRVELRVEEGMGYICDVYYTAAVSHEGRENWWEYYYDTTWISCRCEDWQWNGTVSSTKDRRSLWRSADGARDEETETIEETGSVINSLRDGTFVRTWHTISNHGYPDDWGWEPSYTDTTKEYTRVYDMGRLLSEDGESTDLDKRDADIEGVFWGSYGDEQGRLDRLYW